MSSPKAKPRSDWLRSVEEKGWEVAAEVPGGTLRLDAKDRSVMVMLIMPEGKQKQRSLAQFFGDDAREEALDFARRKAKLLTRLAMPRASGTRKAPAPAMEAPANEYRKGE